MKTLPAGAHPANPAHSSSANCIEHFEPILTLDNIKAFRRERWPGLEAWLFLTLGLATKSHAEMIERTREIRDGHDRGESDEHGVEALEHIQTLRDWLVDTTKIVRAVEHRMLHVIDQVGVEHGEASVFADDDKAADAFDQAYAEIRRLKAIENGMTFENVEEEQAHETEYHAATQATDVALDNLLSIPVTDGKRAVQKLLMIDDCYDLAACGLDRDRLKQLLSEFQAALGEEAGA